MFTFALAASLPGCDEGSGPRDPGAGDRDSEVLGDAGCLFADLDGDFRLDSSDIVEMVSVGYEVPCEDCRADLNVDGMVGSDDLIVIASVGLGEDGAGRDCPSDWAFYSQDAIEAHIGPQAQPSLRDDGVLEVPEGWWERVEAYADAFGDEGPDGYARYIEALIQYGGLDPDYGPHAEMIAAYLAHTTGEGLDDEFRSAGVCKAYCGLSVSGSAGSIERPINACPEWGSSSASGGELVGSCGDVDNGGTVQASYACEVEQKVMPFCIYVETEPGACSVAAIGDDQCQVDIEFSGQGYVRAFARRENNDGAPNNAMAAARLVFTASGKADGTTSHRTTVSGGIESQVYVSEDNLFAEAFGIFVDQLQAIINFGRKCEFGTDGKGLQVACSGDAIADLLGAWWQNQQDQIEFGKAIFAAQEQAESYLSLTKADLPGFAEDLMIPPTRIDGELVRPVTKLAAHKFEGTLRLDSFGEANAGEGVSDFRAEAWAATTYRIKDVDPALDEGLLCKTLPTTFADPDASGPLEHTWQCGDVPFDSFPSTYTLDHPDWIEKPAPE